jgi:hypothetical protein
MGATVGAEGGTTTARGGGAVGRSIGGAIESGVTAFAAFGIFSEAADSLALAPLVLAVPFFLGASFFAVDFFLVDLDFSVELDDFFYFGFASSDSDSFFFAFGVGLDSVASLDFGFLDAVEEVVLLFGFFAFGDAVGDTSVLRVLRNCSRLRSSSSFPCAQR